jgi:hypothetical protein
MRDYTEGMILPSKNGGLFKILKINSYMNVEIEFMIILKFKMTTNLTNARRGTVGNPYAISCCGVGFIGETDGLITTNTPAYKVWSSMLTRCYKDCYIGAKSYLDVTVNETWHNFTNFERWFRTSPRQKGYQLDKDILVEGNKEYSQDSCCFVPKEVNSFFSQRHHKNSKSGYAGVLRHKRDDLWVALDGKVYTKNLDEAVLAQKKFRVALAEKLYNEYNGLLTHAC